MLSLVACGASPKRPGADAGRPDAGAAGGCGRTAEYAFCLSDSSCACPLRCNPDDPAFGFSGAPGMVCERACATTADCPEPQTVCRGGYCAYDLCDASEIELGLPPNGVAGGPCASQDAGDGNCVVLASGLAVCAQAGTSSTACDPGAARAQAASLCLPGEVCVSGSCRPGCNPADGGCAAGERCAPLDPTATGSFPDFGACLAADAG